MEFPNREAQLYQFYADDLRKGAEQPEKKEVEEVKPEKKKKK